ncbi:hypothetical protein TNIN_64131 [Trichonephila inaurata madagascariensis]|uniref:Uncharacterized protein n=1 Tax=Trichonephila inaurata madagascariensis TaxID=2747483 RepID=A0A8X6Y2Y0_9ARAC|nr:hypothetical protein TNIN_64131 [Trichonephila inaurata madagascariensis]
MVYGRNLISLQTTTGKPVVTFPIPSKGRALITSTITRLRTHHYKGMENHPDKTRSYIQCNNFSEIQPLTPKHIFQCPAFTPRALSLGLTPLMDPLQDILYNQNTPELALTVLITFDEVKNSGS